MEKLDLTKKYKAHYSAKATPEIVDIGPAQFLAIDGKGDPSGEAFAERVQALYATAYGIKFSYKTSGQDFVVPKLEGLWWFDQHQYGGFSFAEAPQKVPREEWNYRLLIRMPDYVTEPAVRKGIDTTLTKKKLPLAADIQLYRMVEGRSVQILHTGSFSNEYLSLQKLDDFIRAQGLVGHGLHHEIYLSDFNKTAPEKLKTILREPVR